MEVAIDLDQVTGYIEACGTLVARRSIKIAATLLHTYRNNRRKIKP